MHLPGKNERLSQDTQNSFQGSVYEATLVDGIYCLDQLCHVEFGFVNGEFILLHVGEEVPTYNRQGARDCPPCHE